MLHSLWLLALMATAVAGISCPPNICDTANCKNIKSCQNGYIKQKGSMCGCCDICINYLDEAASCWQHLLVGTPLTSDCKPGFHCSKLTHTCMKNNYVVAPRNKESCTDVRARDNGGEYPVCDNDGTYAPKQCDYSPAGNKYCYCAHKNGQVFRNYIFDETKEDEAVCECAREEDFLLSSGLLGRKVSCDKIGNYERLQCLGSGCYCAESKTGNRIGEVVHISQKHVLHC